MSAAALPDLDLSLPVLAAPMAGGPTTPDLVVAASRAGGLGFLGGGYLDAETLRGQLADVGGRVPSYGVNLFAPNPVPVDPTAYRAYRELLLPEAERYAVTLPAEPVEDDDHWRDKVDVLLEQPPALVSFTFGIPGPDVLAALRRAGCLLVQTITSEAEARHAADAGVDALAVQSAAAGGHLGTLTPAAPPPSLALPDLLARVKDATGLPMVAAGGVAGPDDVVAALAAGAAAVQVGTALLLAPEAGTSAAHRAALLGRDRETVVTRAFTGRPARGLRNRFTEAYDAAAPLGYPALHHLTRPLRRAAAAAADPEPVNLWAGTGHRSAVMRPAAETLQHLAAGL